MGFVFIGAFFTIMFIVTVFWKRRENARVDAALRASYADGMHDANIQGRVDPSLEGYVKPAPFGYAGGFYGTNP